MALRFWQFLDKSIGRFMSYRQKTAKSSFIDERINFGKKHFFKIILMQKKSSRVQKKCFYDVTGDVRLRIFFIIFAVSQIYHWIRKICFFWSPIFWSQVEKRRAYRIALVRTCVHAYVTAYLKNRSMDFSEIWYEVGTPRGLERHTAAFSNCSLVFSKIAHFL